MKKLAKQQVIGGDENGIIELVTISCNWYRYEEQEPFVTSEFAQLKHAFKNCLSSIRSLTHQDTVRSPYDCTGQLFGSNWKRIYWAKDENGYVFVYIHTYAMDV